MISESNEKIKEVAIQCIQKEADAVGRLADYVDDGFVESVRIMFHATEGRIIVTGIGNGKVTITVTSANGKKTMKAYLWYVCGQEYDSQNS